MLKGKKVILRPVKKSDLVHFVKWFNDPEVTQYMGHYLPITEMAEEKWIEDLATNGKINFVIEAINVDNNIPIGSIGFNSIHQKDREGNYGLGIGEKEYWNRGFGTEAAQLLISYGFNQLNLHRITSGVFAFNERSLKMHYKLGFKEEGRRRSARFINGQYWDEVEFGILENEWSRT